MLFVLILAFEFKIRPTHIRKLCYWKYVNCYTQHIRCVPLYNKTFLYVPVLILSMFSKWCALLSYGYGVCSIITLPRVLKRICISTVHIYFCIFCAFISDFVFLLISFYFCCVLVVSAISFLFMYFSVLINGLYILYGLFSLKYWITIINDFTFFVSKIQVILKNITLKINSIYVNQNENYVNGDMRNIKIP